MVFTNAMVVKMLNVSLATTSPSTKSISGSPSDCTNITCNLTINIDNTNHCNRSGHSILWRPGASAAEHSAGKHEKLLLRRKLFFPMYLITKLTLTITLKPYASAAEYTATSTRKITSAAENIFPMFSTTKLTLTLNDPYDDA